MAVLEGSRQRITSAVAQPGKVWSVSARSYNMSSLSGAAINISGTYRPPNRPTDSGEIVSDMPGKF